VCAVTVPHLLLPVSMLKRRADAVSMIGRAALAKALRRQRSHSFPCIVMQSAFVKDSARGATPVGTMTLLVAAG
jgi:hypothetical protein